MAEGLLALIDSIRQLDRKLRSINEEVNGPLLKLIEKHGRHVDEQEKWEGKCPWCGAKVIKVKEDE